MWLAQHRLKGKPMRYYVKAVVNGERRVLASIGPELPLSVVDAHGLAVHRENQRREILRLSAGGRRVDKVPEIEAVSEDPS